MPEAGVDSSSTDAFLGFLTHYVNIIIAISLWKEGKEHCALNTPIKFHIKGETFFATDLIFYR